VHGGILDLHPAQYHFHGHIRQGLVAGLTGENEIPRLELFKLSQDGDGTRRQRHPVRASCLHPVGRYRPGFLVDVDFGPSHSQDFTGAGGGQDA